MAYGIESNGAGGTVITGEGIELTRLICFKVGLNSEIRQEQRHGKVVMRLTRGPLISTRLRKEFGFTGNRNSQLAQLEAYIDERFPSPIS